MQPAHCFCMTSQGHSSVLRHSHTVYCGWVSRKYWKLCLPYNEEDLQWHPVDPQMSKPHFQGPDCSKPLKRPNIANFFKAKPAPGEVLPVDVAFNMSMNLGLFLSCGT